MSAPQSPRLENALWENKAQTARAKAIIDLSRILGLTITSNDFTGRAEFDSHMEYCRSMTLHEERFPVARRDDVVALLQKISALNSTKGALLFLGRSSDLGGLRVRNTPSAATLLSLLDWDQDDVFVFDKSDTLVVHVDRGEDWLKPEDMGIAPREMLYIVSTPT